MDADHDTLVRPYDLYRIDHKLNRARFPQMPMAKDKLVRDYFGTQLFITTSGHFSTPALMCAIQESMPLAPQEFQHHTLSKMNPVHI